MSLELMAPLMFAGLVVFLLLGYPVAFALAANGIIFGLIGIELGLLQPSLFQALPDADAHRLVDIAHRRLAALPPDAFHWRTPIVSVVAERPG